MKEHLGDSQFAAWALGTGEDATLEHLADCAACREEAESFWRRIAAFRDAIHAAAERRQIGWRRPACSAVELRRARGGWTTVHWVATAALVALALGLVLSAPTPKPPRPSASNDAADNALLLAVQEDLDQQLPEALAPAENLTAQADLEAKPVSKVQAEGESRQ